VLYQVPVGCTYSESALSGDRRLVGWWVGGSVCLTLNLVDCEADWTEDTFSFGSNTSLPSFRFGVPQQDPNRAIPASGGIYMPDRSQRDRSCTLLRLQAGFEVYVAILHHSISLTILLSASLSPELLINLGYLRRRYLLNGVQTCQQSSGLQALD
jgi:hypothetical protein